LLVSNNRNEPDPKSSSGTMYDSISKLSQPLSG
jgi:hypothetical protein